MKHLLEERKNFKDIIYKSLDIYAYAVYEYLVLEVNKRAREHRLSDEIDLSGFADGDEKFNMIGEICLMNISSKRIGGIKTWIELHEFLTIRYPENIERKY